jgi:ABC-type phosphate/phosphonate transport system substrate-binding protein
LKCKCSDNPSNRVEIIVAKNSQPIAELGFYPFDDVAWAYDKLWAATAKRCSWLPRELTRTTNPSNLWLSENEFISQTCGWPLVTRLADKVSVIGAFRQTTPESASHFYRSVIVGRVDGTPFDFQGSIAAVNNFESLSGWISLIAAIHGPQETWHGETKISGSHFESLQMLCRGEADIASIDSVTLAHLRRIDTKTIDSLYVIANGPIVPCLPIITHRSISESQRNDLRQALSKSTQDPNIADATSALFINGFDALEIEDYLPLMSLTANF